MSMKAESTHDHLPDASARNVLGDLLRHWRGRRGMSQLDLSLEAGVSQRHISFIESGRSSPSRSLVLGLAQHLEVPLRERNVLLLAAGYAPMYSESPLDSDAMKVITRVLDRMLKQHDPYPALVLDRHWNVTMTNESAPRFFGAFLDLTQFPKPRNLLRLIFDPRGLRPFVSNWDEVAASLFQRVRREAVGGVMDERTQALISELQSLPDVPGDSRTADGPGTSPVVHIEFQHQGRATRWFSMVSTLGTPQAVSAEELRVECMFPADDASEATYLGSLQ
jgi:transcriptional regulator with XRE-family HTH domain